MNYSQEHLRPGKADNLVDAIRIKPPKSSIDWVRWLFLAVMAIFLLVVGYRTIYNVAWNDVERGDFTVYRAAGQAVIDSTNIYQAQNIHGWLYVYPPPFAILLIPFAKLPLAWGSGLWYLLSLAALASATMMAVKLASELVPDAAKKIGEDALGQRLLELMEHRWNGSFNSIGQHLSKNQSGDATD